MTLFAVACAGMFPLLHLGRPWLFYWLFPYPNTMSYWPNFRSPLVWDVFAVTTYLTISLVFWFVGLIPDLATMRDQTDNKALKFVFGAAAMGWRNSVRHWNRYETAYLLLGRTGNAAGALGAHGCELRLLGGHCSGMAYHDFPALLCCGRDLFRIRHGAGAGDSHPQVLQHRRFHHQRHIENSAMVMLATGWIVAYGYAFEAFMNWYGGDPYESFLRWNRLHGPYAPFYYALLVTNLVIPQVLWVKKIRNNNFLAVPGFARCTGGHVAGAVHYRRSSA